LLNTSDLQPAWNFNAETAIKLLPVKFLTSNLKFPWLFSIQVRILVALPPRFIRILCEKLFDNANFLEFGG